MEIDLATITASAAGVCMAVCQVPQAVKLFRDGNTEGISIWMQMVLTMGIAFWLVTGILLSNVPMWLSNGTCLLFCLYVDYKCIARRWTKDSRSHMAGKE